jgi:hypothetical protein
VERRPGLDLTPITHHPQREASSWPTIADRQPHVVTSQLGASAPKSRRRIKLTRPRPRRGVRWCQWPAHLANRTVCFWAYQSHSAPAPWMLASFPVDDELIAMTTRR